MEKKGREGKRREEGVGERESPRPQSNANNMKWKEEGGREGGREGGKASVSSFFCFCFYAPARENARMCVS